IILMTNFVHRCVSYLASGVLVVVLILGSYGLIAYLLKWFADYMMGISVRKLRVKSKVDKLKNHYIICGMGRVGSQVAREMKQEGVSFVALDRDPARIQEALDAGYLALELDSMNEEALQQAGIERASGLVASL